MSSKIRIMTLLVFTFVLLVASGCGGGTGETPTEFSPIDAPAVSILRNSNKAPELESVVQNGTNYFLTWSQPGRGPSDGYDLVLDGVLTTAYRTNQLNALVSGLTMGTEHCFQIQARFLQSRPEEFPLSNEICLSPPIDPKPSPDPIYSAPILDPIQINGTSYILTWSQPGEMPTGGFELIIDGVNTDSANRTFETSAVISGLAATEEHCFQVQAKFLQADPDQFPVSNESCITPPSVTTPEPDPAPVPTYTAPVLNPVEVNGTNFILTWIQDGETPTGGYDVFVDSIDTGTVNRTSDTNVALSGLTAGEEHCFEVKGRFLQADPDQYLISNRQCTAALGIDTAPPTAPQSILASTVSSTEINLSWKASSDDFGVAGYQVYRNGVAVGTTAQTTFSDVDLAPDAYYSYTVVAFDATGNESPHSAIAEGTTVAGNIYRVGPNRTYTTLQDVQSRLQPGDLVLVDGNAVYPGGITFSNAGTAERKITIRGEKTSGNRPVIEGGYNAVEFNRNHYIFQGFEIRNATSRGLFHHAHDITIRDCIVHNCPNGIVGADQGSGSLTVEYCEVYGCGNGTYKHQLYIATNENDYPGSVFRLQFSYIHDAAGGHNVKSRAERNEIYFNWLDNPMYHNLELIGPDPAGGVAEGVAREDSDVVGNVLIARRYGRNVRIGGDGTGQSNGRYRFVNNTFIHNYSSPRSHVFAHFGVESVEMHNNIFLIPSYNVFDDSEAAWAYGRRKTGSNNWAHTGAGIPAEWTGTLRGTDAGLEDLANDHLRPLAWATIIDGGAETTASPNGSPFPNPLNTVGYHPPESALIQVGTVEKRTVDSQIDIGAFELE